MIDQESFVSIRTKYGLSNGCEIDERKLGVIADQEKNDMTTSNCIVISRDFDRERLILLERLKRILVALRNQMVEGILSVVDDSHPLVAQLCALLELSMLHGFQFNGDPNPF